MRCVSISALLLCVMSGVASAQTPRTSGKGERVTPQSAAAAALPTLRRAATGEGARLLGFRSAEEAAQARLGEPFVISYVPLEGLREYDASKNPSSIILDGRRMLFPVLVGAETRTGIEVSEKHGWHASAIGGSAIALLLEEARTAHRGSHPGSSYFAVQVPALNLYFLGVDTAGARMLIPLANDERFPRLRAGEAVGASEALAELVPAARQLDPKQSS